MCVSSYVDENGLVEANCLSECKFSNEMNSIVMFKYVMLDVAQKERLSQRITTGCSRCNHKLSSISVYFLLCRVLQHSDHPKLALQTDGEEEIPHQLAETEIRHSLIIKK
jgi:hypothetical protein